MCANASENVARSGDGETVPHAQVPVIAGGWQSQLVVDIDPGRALPPSAPRRQRRVSKDILTALTQLELVSDRTSEAIETLNRSRRPSLACVADEGDLPEWKVREQLAEIKSRLRETKAELASVSYRAEMLESEGKNLRRQLASVCEKIDDDPGKWQLIESTSVTAILSDESSCGDSKIAMALLLDEKESLIDRLTQQLDFYARELEAKVEREQHYKTALAKTTEQCKQLEQRLRHEERRNATLRQERKKFVAMQDMVHALSESYQAQYGRLEALLASGEALSRSMAVRDSVVNDLVIESSVMEQKLREVRLQAQHMAEEVMGDRETEMIAYREEVGWLRQCLLRTLFADGERAKQTQEQLPPT